MRDHYSSVSAEEQPNGIGSVLQLAEAVIPKKPEPANGMQGGMQTPEAVCTPENRDQGGE
jgi:hypothetical protein